MLVIKVMYTKQFWQVLGTMNFRVTGGKAIQIAHIRNKATMTGPVNTKHTIYILGMIFGIYTRC